MHDWTTDILKPIVSKTNKCIKCDRLIVTAQIVEVMFKFSHRFDTVQMLQMRQSLITHNVIKRKNITHLNKNKNTSGHNKSHHPLIGEAKIAIFAHNDVVNDEDVHDFSGIDHTTGNLFIGRARLNATRWMVVA